MIINTAEMLFTDWARGVAQQLGQIGVTIAVSPDDDWREWAYRVLMLPQVSNQYAPRPGHFDDWREWANAFNLSVRY